MSKINQLAKKRTGFTLVELLVVIGAIVVLFSIVLIAIDPAKRLKQSRDAVRRQDVTNVLEAIQEYATDNSGSFPAGIDSTAGTYQVLGTASSGCTCTAAASTAA